MTPSKRDWLPCKTRGKGLDSWCLVLAINQGGCANISQHVWVVRPVQQGRRSMRNMYRKTVRCALSLESILYKCCSSLLLKSHFRVKVKSWPSFVGVKWNPNEQRERQRLTPPRLLLWGPGLPQLGSATSYFYAYLRSFQRWVASSFAQILRLSQQMGFKLAINKHWLLWPHVHGSRVQSLWCSQCTPSNPHRIMARVAYSIL